MNLDELSDKNFFTIGEVSRAIAIPEYTIRYWENRFKLLRPQRRESGHRRYSKKEIQILLDIKDLIYQKKLTLEGAKRHLSKKNPQIIQSDSDQINDKALKLLKEIHKELSGILKEC
jgi:DNA-binding transcriptional MerR regulator